jgi:putative transposase
LLRWNAADLGVAIGSEGRLSIARKANRPEQIIAMPRKADVALGDEVSRDPGITWVTHYRWRKEYSGLKLDQAKRLKELERENARLRKAVSDLTLDELILKEAAKGNF